MKETATSYNGNTDNKLSIIRHETFEEDEMPMEYNHDETIKYSLQIQENKMHTSKLQSGGQTQVQ